MQKLNFKNNVSETLLINVYMRHLDFKDADPILNDPFSSAVVEQIDYDFAKFNDARLSKTGTVIRAKFFDDETLRLAAEFDHPVIVQLGAGLDTRPLRLQKALPHALFYDLDLPDVISVRDEMLQPALLDARSLVDGRASRKARQRGLHLHLRGREYVF